MISINKKLTEDCKIQYEVTENGVTLAFCEGKLSNETLIITNISISSNDINLLDGAIRAMMSYALQINYNCADFSKLSQEKLQIVIDLGFVGEVPVISDIDEFFSNKKCISI